MVLDNLLQQESMQQHLIPTAIDTHSAEELDLWVGAYFGLVNDSRLI